MSAELQSLKAEAAALDAPPISDKAKPGAGAAPPGEPPPAEPEQPAIPASVHVRTALDWAADRAIEQRPELAPVFQEGRRKELSERAGAVLDKHKITLPAWLERWRPELLLLVSVWSTVQAVAAVVKAKAQRDTRPAPAAPVPPVEPAAPVKVHPRGVVERAS